MSVKIIFILILSVFCFSCVQKNEKDTIGWIEKSQKPIVCKMYGYNGWGYVNYTLISKDSKIFNTGCVSLYLPDTIK